MQPETSTAVQEDDYLQTATMYYDKLNSWKADNYAYDWDNKSPALHVLLTQIFPSEMMKCVLSPLLPWPTRLRDSHDSYS